MRNQIWTEFVRLIRTTHPRDWPALLRDFLGFGLVVTVWTCAATALA